MSELTEIKAMLTEIKDSVIEIKVHNEYTKEKLDSHSATIDKLQSAHNKQKGALWLIGAIGLTGLEEWIRTHV